MIARIYTATAVTFTIIALSTGSALAAFVALVTLVTLPEIIQ